LDGGKAGLQKTFLQMFKRSQIANPKTLNIIYSEETLLHYRSQRLGQQTTKSRGFTTLRQIEGALMVGKVEPSHLGRRPNLNFDGTTTGTCLVHATCPNLESAWKLNTVLKRRCLGNSRVTGVACKRSNKDKRAAAKANEVPEEQIMNFDAMHSSLYEELFHRTGAECLLHLSAKDETCAAVAIQKHIKYVGVTFSELHSVHLLRRVEQAIFFSFLTPDGAFYKPGLAKLLATFCPALTTAPEAKADLKRKTLDSVRKAVNKLRFRFKKTRQLEAGASSADLPLADDGGSSSDAGQRSDDDDE
jgi:hypothetical protein